MRECDHEFSLLETLIQEASACQASDLLLRPGQKPWMKVALAWRLLENYPDITDASLSGISLLLPTSALCVGDYAVDWFGTRLRLHLYMSLSGLSVCIRLLPSEIPSCENLTVPSAVLQALDARHGLILVTGATGQGKTTTLASLIQQAKNTSARHIICLEDPIEYLQAPAQSLVSQRELGVHFQTFSAGLKESLRQAPDVIVVGEVRDSDTMRMVLEAASTGHLVLASLHTADVLGTFQRILHFFTPSEQAYMQHLLAEVLLTVQTQRLIRQGDGLLAEYEIFVNTAASKSLIQRGEFTQIKSLMQTGHRQGMRLFT